MIHVFDWLLLILHSFTSIFLAFFEFFSIFFELSRTWYFSMLSDFDVLFHFIWYVLMNCCLKFCYLYLNRENMRISERKSDTVSREYVEYCLIMMIWEVVRSLTLSSPTAKISDNVIDGCFSFLKEILSDNEWLKELVFLQKQQCPASKTSRLF